MTNKSIQPVDKIGRPIRIGDRVAAVTVSGSYYYFKFGIVDKFVNSGHQIYVLFDGNNKSSRKQTEKIIVITGQERLNKEEYPELYI